MITKKEWEEALVKRYSYELYEKFSKAHVAVCGIGGLGSNIAFMLARAGVGKLTLVDFDKVDISNLHRQNYKVGQIGMFKTDALFENLSEIAPFTDIRLCNKRITYDNIGEIIRDADIVCEAFDNAESKAELANAVLVKYPEKYLISSSGMAGLDSANLIKTRKITNRFYLCGDEKSDVNTDIGLISSRVTLCAAHQAHTVLRILSGKFDV